MEKCHHEEYDYLMIGTGLSETAISYLLSKEKGVKILHIDTNKTYGSEFSTLQFSELLKHFNQFNNMNKKGIDDENVQIDKELLEQSRDFNIDLIPKLLLHDSQMKDFLLANEIHELVDFTSIKESYLFTDTLHSIPTSEASALKSSLISFSQKFKVINFFWNIRKYAKSESKDTFFAEQTMAKEFSSYGLSPSIVDFIGHAIALNLNDKYLDQHPKYTYDKIIRYISSIVEYENTESPFLYPLYGLSEICQAFSRKSALNGTVFMLNAKIEHLSNDGVELVDPSGIKHTIKAKQIISDPKYWPDSKKSKEIIRCIFIMKSGMKRSRNIIFLRSQLKRKHDVFCVVLGSKEQACPEGFEIAIISTVKETEEPENEIKHVLSHFPVLRYFIEVRQTYSHENFDNVYFTNATDESPLFDNVYNDIQSTLTKLGKSL